MSSNISNQKYFENICHRLSTIVATFRFQVIMSIKHQCQECRITQWEGGRECYLLCGGNIPLLVDGD